MRDDGGVWFQAGVEVACGTIPEACAYMLALGLGTLFTGSSMMINSPKTRERPPRPHRLNAHRQAPFSHC